MWEKWKPSSNFRHKWSFVCVCITLASMSFISVIIVTMYYSGIMSFISVIIVTMYYSGIMLFFSVIIVTMRYSGIISFISVIIITMHYSSIILLVIIPRNRFCLLSESGSFVYHPKWDFLIIIPKGAYDI